MIVVRIRVQGVSPVLAGRVRFGRSKECSGRKTSSVEVIQMEPIPYKWNMDRLNVVGLNYGRVECLSWKG